MMPQVTNHRPPEQSSAPAAAAQHGRTAFRSLLCSAMTLLIGLATAHADTNEFDLYPKWVRPGPDTIVRVKLSENIDVNKKLFLRLTLPNATIADLPLVSEQAHRRVADVKIPGPLRRGTYQAELVNEEGVVLASGPKAVTVATSEKPVITAILPKVIYPKDGSYDFDIISDNFNKLDEEKVVIRINDFEMRDLKKCEYDTAGKLLASHDKRNLPCLDSGWRVLQVKNLSLDKLAIGRPLEISVEVDKLVSDPKPLSLSLVQRSVPRMIAIAVLGAVITLVYFLFIRKMTRNQPEKTQCPLLTSLFIDPQTNTYSLSKLQMVIWAAAAILAYSYLSASQFLAQWKLGIPNVPEGLPMLLGISASTTALAVGATEFRGSKGAGMVHPGLADFITTGGMFAPERLQFFIWTILGALTFVTATLAQDPGTVTEMANIPNTFNQLMGASSLGYLAGKFTRKPGPVITTVTIDDRSSEIKIVGENLSPRAQLLLNGQPSTYRVILDRCQTADEEFMSELTLQPGNEKKGADDGNNGATDVVRLKIKNPDGQVAEWIATARLDGPAVA